MKAVEFQLLEKKNSFTQPCSRFAVFNNPSVIADGWYFAFKSDELKKLNVKRLQVGNQELAVWRGESGQVYAVDAFCPHMGTHLSKGKVSGEWIQCFFHHWKFDGQGHCRHLPADPEFASRPKMRGYRVTEKFGGIFIYPKHDDVPDLLDFDELAGESCKISFGKSYPRQCHHHVTMINGLDPQHLKTVHNIDIEMEVEIEESKRSIEVILSGLLGTKGLIERGITWCIGSRYSYVMTYDHGSVGLLTLLKNARWRGQGAKLPSLHMIFAYRPGRNGTAMVQPIFVTKRSKGLLGFIKAEFLLWFTRRCFAGLQGEDGEVYDNMRFYPQNLLPMDRPVAQYIRYINQLEISSWSEASVLNKQRAESFLM